ncbi:PHP domain-containing protein [Desulfocucumis palustris]|uniref:PHP domain-containing protein n=1 Tax=Desulfocucumis palustris TaxID=1898651 RepID=UPI000CEA5FD8|nr:PHP domain-containing protein [Desulfocucumis palustris]
MRLWADFHTHTVKSDGRGTIRENVQAAAKSGLKAVGITDHGPRGIGIGVENLSVYRESAAEAGKLEEEFQIRVLIGAEANVTGTDGKLDIPPELAGRLDLLVAGLHPFVLPDRGSEALTWLLPNQFARVSRFARERLRSGNTKAQAEAVRKNPVDIVSHPNLMLAVDLDELARVCARYGTAMEINTGHKYDKEEIVTAALRHGTPISVNSDAHTPSGVGRLGEGEALLERLNFPMEQVFNTRSDFPAGKFRRV